MPMWIKICGLTTREAIETAINERVDAIGFVFAPSKRQVSAKQAVDLTRGISSSVLRVAVMQHPAQSLVDEVLAVFKPDVLQTDFEDIAGLTLPVGLSVVPVMRAGKSLPSALPPRILFEGPVSGTGETADWMRAETLASQTQLILAGGLNPSNVAQAIVMVKPFGVDVSSGVESAPGVKDVERMREFVRAVRMALPPALSHEGRGS
jgi:phosphoribosylanthranilate isomerase